jgi:transposase
VEFLPESGQYAYRTGETMTRRPRRNHPPFFRAKLDLAAVKGEKTLLELAQQFDNHPKRQFPLMLRVDGAVAGRFEGPVVVQPERGALSISDDHV